MMMPYLQETKNRSSKNKHTIKMRIEAMSEVCIKINVEFTLLPFETFLIAFMVLCKHDTTNFI